MRLPFAVCFALVLLGCSKEAPPPPPPAVAAFVPPSPSPPSEQAPACARPMEKAAFDVTGLKSQLMVTAISCQAEDKYNAFVTRYRSDLVGEDKALNAFFGRIYGRRAQQEHDDYITQLANAQSELGLKSGSEFCRFNVGMLDEVMSLKNDTDLPGFAAGKPIQQSLAVEVCPDTPVAKPVAAAAKKK